MQLTNEIILAESRNFSVEALVRLKNLGVKHFRKTLYPAVTGAESMNALPQVSRDFLANKLGVPNPLFELPPKADIEMKLEERSDPRFRPVIELDYEGEQRHEVFIAQVRKELPPLWSAYYIENYERNSKKNTMILICDLDPYQFIKLTGTANSAFAGGAEKVIDFAKRTAVLYEAVLVGARKMMCEFTFSKTSPKLDDLAGEILALCPKLSYIGATKESVVNQLERNGYHQLVW